VKIAIVQDWLTSYGGAEKCIEAWCEIWPEADIYTLVYRADLFKNSIISRHKVRTSFIQQLPLSKTKFRHYLLLHPFAVEQYDLRHYDIIISSSAAFSHGVITGADQLHICYKHTPMRYAWSGYHEYLHQRYVRSKAKNWITRVALHRLRTWDFIAAQRPDLIVANSQQVRRRIWKYYRREAEVIYPPVDVDGIEPLPAQARDGYYVTMSRMVPYKKMDLIIETFAQTSNLPLIVAGDGPEMARLKKLAKNAPNINFFGFINSDRKTELLRKAKAFIFAACEDFGIAPIEAQACGTPVIAYGRGGALESVVDEKTGVFFAEQNIGGLKKAIDKFLTLKDSFDPVIIHEHAKKFDKEIFKRKFKRRVQEKAADFRKCCRPKLTDPHPERDFSFQR